MTSNGLLFNLSDQKEQVLTYLYAEFSKQLFNDTSYYQIVLPRDKMIKKVLSKQKYFKKIFTYFLIYLTITHYFNFNFGFSKYFI